MSGDTIKTDLKPKTFLIEHIPAILLGEPSDKIYLFVDGQGGNKEEAIGFALGGIPFRCGIRPPKSYMPYKITSYSVKPWISLSKSSARG